MSDSASVLGSLARLVLAWLADVAALTRNTNARGRTMTATAMAASHLNTGCSQGHVPGKATRRCNHPVRSPCKRHARSTGRRQNRHLATSRHHAEAAVQCPSGWGSGTTGAISQNTATKGPLGSELGMWSIVVT